MSRLNHYTQEFLRGLRSVPEYLETVCQSCNGGCREKVDDQCLISAWCGYIEAAFQENYDAREVGRRCASAQVARFEPHVAPPESAAQPHCKPLPCQRAQA